MNTYKIVVSYDGTHFAGWQVQPNGKSIADHMQRTFVGIFNTPIKLIAASRTDAGVHALGQVAIFSTPLSVEPHILMRAWNDALPDGIVIRQLELSPDNFHPRFNVVQKTYHYYFFTQQPSPFVERYGWYYRYNINMNHLQDALALFKGTHDFRSFCTGDEAETTIRTIDDIYVTWDERVQAHCIVFKGRGFLRFMIRRIVGACLDVASKELPLSLLREALAEKNPNQSLYKAPAKGLILQSIVY